MSTFFSLWDFNGMGNTCAYCANPATMRYHGHRMGNFGKGSEYVVIFCCSEHRENVEKVDIVQNYKTLVYVILSGWPNNPEWYCPVAYFPQAKKVAHLHSTPSVEDGPKVFSGNVSGLYFEARNTHWPIESREGLLLLVTVTNDIREEKEIGIEEALKLLEEV